MKKFFVNKYPIKVFVNGKERILPEGTIFTIGCINGNFFDLNPISSKVVADFPVTIDSLMLQTGFTKQDHID